MEMKVKKQHNKDGSIYYAAYGEHEGVKFIAEGETEGEAFQAALIAIRERGISRCFTPYLKVIECP